MNFMHLRHCAKIPEELQLASTLPSCAAIMSGVSPSLSTTLNHSVDMQ